MRNAASISHGAEDLYPDSISPIEAIPISPVTARPANTATLSILGMGRVIIAAITEAKIANSYHALGFKPLGTGIRYIIMKINIGIIARTNFCVLLLLIKYTHFSIQNNVN